MNQQYIREGRVFYDLPKPLAVAEYQACCDAAVTEAKNNPDIAAIYRMGAPWKPGISDLDLLIVYRTIGGKRLSDPWQLTPEARYIFTHRILSIDEKNFKDFYYLYPKKTAQLQLLFGDSKEPRDPLEDFSIADAKLLYASILLDVAINKLLLFPRYESGSIDVRQVIGELFSLRYTFDILEFIIGERVETVFETKITQLRDQWFDKSIEENLQILLALLEESKAVVGRVTLALDGFLARINLSGGMRQMANERLTLRFDKKWETQTFLGCFRRYSRKLRFRGRVFERFFLLLPESCAAILAMYAAAEGAISEKLQYSASGLVQPEDVPTPIARHIAVLNSYYALSCDTRGYFKIPYAYGFGPTHNTFVESIKRKIKHLFISVSFLANLLDQK